MARHITLLWEKTRRFVKVLPSARHALFAFSIRMASASISFFTQIFLARWMGTYDFGLYSYVTLWILVLGTCSGLGFATSVIKFLPLYQESRRWPEFLGFLSYSRWMSAGSGILFSLGVLAVTVLWPSYFGAHLAAVQIALLSLPAYALTDLQDGIGRSQGWLGIALFPIFIVRPLLIAGTAFGVVTVSGSLEAPVAMVCQVVCVWAVYLGQGILERRALRRSFPDVCGVSLVYHPKRWLLFSLPLMVSDMLGLVKINLDLLLLELYRSPAEVGIYFAASRISAMILFVHFSINAVVMPIFSRFYAKGEHGMMKKTLLYSIVAMVVPSVFGVGILVVLGQLLLGLFGPHFDAAFGAMIVLSIAFTIKACSGASQSFLVICDRQNLSLMLSGITCVIGVGVGIFLIPPLGIMGSALTSVVMFGVEALVFGICAWRLIGKTSG